MSSELKKQMENFIKMADYYVLLASRIQAFRLAIRAVRSDENIIFPPNNESVQKIATETIFLRCLHFAHKQLAPPKRLNYFLKVGSEKIQSLKIEKLFSFEKMEKFCIYLSIMYMNYARSDELKWLYNEFANSTVDIRIFSEQLSKNTFIAMTHNTDALGEQLEAKFKQMEGYWTSKLERIKASQKGWKAKSQMKQERLQRLKEMVERKAEKKGSEYFVSKSEWVKEFGNIFGYNSVSDRTRSTYKKELEENFTSSSKKKIKIVLKK
jgi:hypothetical protein